MMEIRKNHLLRSLVLLPKIWTLSFLMNQRNIHINKWTSVMHFTTGENKGPYGSRAPGIFMYGDLLYVCLPISGDDNFCVNIKITILNEWWDVKIISSVVDSKYWMEVNVNGTQLLKRENTRAEAFANVKVYMGSPWMEPFDGYIRNLSLEVTGPVEKISLSNAEQSSTHFPASHAIDGDIDGFGSTTGCAETDNHHNVNWWQGQFDRMYMNIRIRLMPRTDYYRKGRYKRVKVFVGVDGYTWELCKDLGNSLETSNTWVDAYCPKYMKAKYVKVALHNKQRFALCELEAWGLPLDSVPKCVGNIAQDDCCTAATPCEEGEGDCDASSHCKGDLVCGKNNCQWGGDADCCTPKSVNTTVKTPPNARCMFHFNPQSVADCCTPSQPCGLGEGDCDKDSDCKGDLVCNQGMDNCEWSRDADCCAAR